jgi:D-glycero-D-manno-heptose 1,7-bisphosphate phosphatase
MTASTRTFRGRLGGETLEAWPSGRDFSSIGVRPACFLDRDGTIIDQVEYLSDPQQVRLLPGAAAAIARLNQFGIPVVVVTNQAGMALGRFSEPSIAAIHSRLDSLLVAEGAFIDRYYYCPHHPAGVVDAYRAVCDCRKPQPGMLRRAAAELRLELKRSVMIGDKLSDLEAGRAAGCRAMLVRTGYGAAAEQSLGALAGQVAVCDNLEEAVAACLPDLTRQVELAA